MKLEFLPCTFYQVLLYKLETLDVHLTISTIDHKVLQFGSYCMVS